MYCQLKTLSVSSTVYENYYTTTRKSYIPLHKRNSPWISKIEFRIKVRHMLIFIAYSEDLRLFLFFYIYIFVLAVERILQIKRENKSVLTVDGSIFSDEKNLKVIEYL